MQAVTPESVLGDFSDRDFSGSGSSAHFSHSQTGRYIVNTEDADGVKKDFPVQYVFGVSPLQQYLLALPRGKLQAFSIAWDVQQKKWFHLYPNETIEPNDPLHWTQPAQNWNFMCAECHSTDLKKNYDPFKDSYATSWFQINVGCQACHGPASNHLQWAQTPHERTACGAHKGFAVDLSSADSTVQIEACARCHSRRSVIAPHYAYGKRLLDFYRPALLDESLYYPDGQQEDEVYEYGSFVQSKMAHKGLRCSDCHNPHSARPKVEGNALCATCHNARGAALRSGIDGSGLQKKNYDSAAHHFHTPGQPGSHCIECHAPAKKYMVIDARIDHSFRIPRPDLTLKIGTPNACNRCHSNKSPQWALAQIQKHHPDFSTASHYGEALAAGRDAKAGAVTRLRAVTVDKQYAAIVRASALRLLRRYPGALSADLLQSTLQDLDPIVRVTAVESFSDIPAEEWQRWLSPLLRDPVRAVRIEAARALAALPAR
ncbi:MAG TPA: HEAT repeat domain-containing protein, partial [Spongiibacteraceae bacterium]|nr:HEAT repeat domain-containing protein [Spongiibacteraceae bacterium]